MIGQQHLCKVQLVNWGTFQGARQFDVPRAGLLLTGPSGSGKSSVLDAMAAILVKPARARFNAAAQGTDTGDRDRNLLTYVRGAYKRRTDEQTGEIQTAYLRTGATWSGIALTFGDGQQQRVTLVRLFHIARATNDAKDLKSVFMLADGEVELLALAPYVENGLEVRRLKREFPGQDVFSGEAYSSFANKFRRRLGITSEQAQLLLHKTQSAKNLTSLDSLFREFMLDEPRSFELADETVVQFTELSTAHSAVVDARRQVEALTPLRISDQELTRLNAQLTHLSNLEDQVGTWVRDKRLAEYRGQEHRLQQELRSTAAELSSAEQAKLAADTALRDAERALDGAGGAEGEQLLELRAVQIAVLGQRRAERSRLSDLAAGERLSLPASEIDTERFAREAAAREAEVSAQLRQRKTSTHDRHARRSQASQRRAAIVDALKGLRQHHSNLDRMLLNVRSLLAERLQVDESRLPFVGELLEVRAAERAWSGAIERVLGSFARTLVVPDAHYRAAAEIIDEENLHTRLVYERVFPGQAASRNVPDDPRSLVHKLALADGPFSGWLWERLCTRYDYACVDHPEGFAGVRRAVTINGQMKHSEYRHEKDDRSRLNDRANWVLGFTTEAKETELEARLRQAEDELRAAEAELQADDDQNEALRQRQRVLDELQRCSWATIDVAAAQQKVSELDARLAQLHQAQPDLARLESVRAQLQQRADHTEQIRQQLALRRAQVDHRLAELGALIASLADQIAQAVPVPAEVAADLEELATETGDVADELALRRELGQRHKKLDDAVHKTQQSAVRAMSHYRQNWPVPSADWGDDTEYLADYLARLRSLEDDGLPAFENRFFDLLQRQARNNISQLALVIKGARRDVRIRVDEVNRSLLMTEFAPASFLQIEVRDRTLPQVEEFLASLAKITSGSLAGTLEDQDDREAAERRFELMQALLDRLRSADPADKNWRRLCLDTRQHVSFQARVQDAERNALDHYTGSGGRSGGERQRLVTFCLAAALRFQLAPADQERPEYALVVIDEAFDKADHNFTKAGLEVFRQFGFQLLLATPLKMLQTIEDYVGGVVMVSNEAGNSSQLHQLIFDNDDVDDDPGTTVQDRLL